MERISVDGHEVVVPTPLEWCSLVVDGAYAGLAIFEPATEHLIRGLLSFVTTHACGFRVGLLKLPGFRAWIALPLLRFGAGWQRVQIERASCGPCGWHGRAANPAEPTLYFGVPDELETTRRAARLPRRGCPRCGGPLDRPAIWLEDLREQNSIG